MTGLQILRVDGLLTVQDLGRPGHLAEGISCGGAMDRLALIDAAALLSSDTILPAIEMAGAGGVFSVTQPMRIALTGAAMTAALDGSPIAWHGVHLVQPGQKLRIGGTQTGVYGYMTPAGGLQTMVWLDSQATHLSIDVGGPLANGETLLCGPDPAPERPARIINASHRFAGGTVRVMDGPQTSLFDDHVLSTFYKTTFTRAPRGNRQGVQLDAKQRFTSSHASSLASDLIGPGDLQMTGDGLPYVLMAECQTMGGYPRIGTVIAADLPIIAQAAPGTLVRFQRLPVEKADALHWNVPCLLRAAATMCRDMIRDPRTIADLLSYQLISGVSRGDELEDVSLPVKGSTKAYPLRSGETIC